MTDKELGLELQNKESTYWVGCKHPNTKSFIFSVRNGRFAEQFNALDENGNIYLIRRKVFNMIKPSGNILNGYTPGSVVNRFDTAEV